MARRISSKGAVRLCGFSILPVNSVGFSRLVSQRRVISKRNGIVRIIDGVRHCVPNERKDILRIYTDFLFAGKAEKEARIDSLGLRKDSASTKFAWLTVSSNHGRS